LHITLFDCIGGVPPQLALVPSEKGSADREHQTERDPTVRLATGPALGRRSWRDASRPHRSTLAGTGRHAQARACATCQRMRCRRLGFGGIGWAACQILFIVVFCERSMTAPSRLRVNAAASDAL
jgi:hypothetical protein